MSARQDIFVHEYLIDLNASAAARRAGYSENVATKQAPTWVGPNRDLVPLHYQKIWDAVQVAKAKRVERTQVDADTVLRKLDEIVNCDISQAFAADGSLLPIKDMPKAVAWLLAGFEVDTKYNVVMQKKAEKEAKKPKKGTKPKLVAVDGKTQGDATPEELQGEVKFFPSQTTKIKLLNRLDALKMLGDHIKVQAFRQNVKTDQPPGQTIINNGPPIPQDQLDQLLALGQNLSIVEALANAAPPAGAIPADNAAAIAPTPASPAGGHERGAIPAAGLPDPDAASVHTAAGELSEEGQGPE